MDEQTNILDSLMSQVPSALGPSSGQNLTTVFRLQPRQKAKRSLPFQRRWLVGITSRLESSLYELREKQESRNRLTLFWVSERSGKGGGSGKSAHRTGHGRIAQKRKSTSLAHHGQRQTLERFGERKHGATDVLVLA